MTGGGPTKLNGAMIGGGDVVEHGDQPGRRARRLSCRSVSRRPDRALECADRRRCGDPAQRGDRRPERRARLHHQSGQCAGRLPRRPHRHAQRALERADRRRHRDPAQPDAGRRRRRPGLPPQPRQQLGRLWRRPGPGHQGRAPARAACRRHRRGRQRPAGLQRRRLVDLSSFPGLHHLSRQPQHPLRRRRDRRRRDRALPVRRGRTARCPARRRRGAWRHPGDGDLHRADERRRQPDHRPTR